MNFKLLAILLFGYLAPNLYAQQVEITPLHEFENLSISKMLINSEGNLVVAGSKWDGVTNFYFGIYDTSNYQLIADTMYSDWQCMNPHNVFNDLVVHPDSGYLVCGRISECGGNQPVIYWFNNQAQLIGEFNGDYWGNSNDGHRPTFENIIVRSDDHILATYRYTIFATNSDSIKATVLMEFDKSLNLLNSDTIRRSHRFRIRYEKDAEKIILYGEKFTGNGPAFTHPYYGIIDAFTFNSSSELIFTNHNGYSDGVLLDSNKLYVSFNTPEYFNNSQNIYTFNVTTNSLTDSLIIWQDSIKFVSSYLSSLYLIDDRLVFFGAMLDYHSPIIDFNINYIRILNSNLEIIKDTLFVNEINEQSIGSTFDFERNFYYTYRKDYSPQPAVTVLKKASISTITTTVQEQKKQFPIKVFPNPTKEELHFITPQNYRNEKLTYQIFSVSGVLLKTGILPKSLNISDIPMGLYILTISNNNEILFNTKISKL